MDGKNSERDIWLTYCEDCVKSKIDKKVPQELNEEQREDINL
jgi:hypothetical protein